MALGLCNKKSRRLPWQIIACARVPWAIHLEISHGIIMRGMRTTALGLDWPKFDIKLYSDKKYIHNKDKEVLNENMEQA